MNPDRIERDVLIAAPPERVWAHLTDFFWVADEGRGGAEPRTGETFVATSKEYGDFPIRIEQAAPHRFLSYRWASAFPGAEPAEGNSTLVEFTLTEEQGGTRLAVVETGFASLPEASRRQAFEDNDGGWAAQLGVLRERAQGGVPLDRFEREIVIAAPVERVWAALTAPEFWLGEADPKGFAISEGARIVGEHEGLGTLPHHILRVDPPRHLSYRWANRFPSTEPDQNNSTLVEFTLVPEGNGTRLRMVESGFATLALPENELLTAAEANGGGWDTVLGELKDSVEE
ncbi:SRPBCC domain-containing protein [Prauserella sp. PE36]|uniref:SRPBCC domain-containing protein n=1 Tax=Prauserella sp. PE36 TaxID=1504709 RepID=UPI001F3D0BC1|nr:SRPBCC domain-containing protein [Prauserella sp. PE36]